MTSPASPSPLRQLLQQPRFRLWVLVTTFARLPLTMNLLALVLVGEDLTGSLATGATLAGVATFSSGLFAQPRGRMLDRTELRGGLRRDLLAAAATMGIFAAAAAAAAPIPVLLGIAALLGVVTAAIMGGMRALLVPCVSADDIEPANALDAVFVEVAFVAGPALAGGLALLVGAVGVMVLQTLGFLVAALLIVRLPQRHPAPDLSLAGPAPWRTRGAGPVYLLCLALGASLGGWEATMPSRIDAFGWDPEAAGPLLALTALGSGLGGVVAANMRDPLRQGRLLGGVLLLVFGAVMLPTAVAPTVLVLGVSLFFVGLPIAPLNALAGLTLQRTVAEPRQAEGFALYPAMILIGAGSGQALAGVALDRIGPAALIVVLAVIPSALGVIVLGAAGRRMVRGLPTGLGYRHDPTITDPGSFVAAPG